MFVANHSNPNHPHARGADRAALPMVYQHCKRAQWGLAALVWEREGKRSYRFEDGSERIFREDFYHLLEAKPAVGEAAEKLLATVHREAAQAKAVEAGAPRVPAPQLEELIAVFHELFPQGFADPQWVLGRRGEGPGATRRAKRHRAPALVDAAQQLDRAVLDELLANGGAAEVLARVQSVLEATDLVTSKQLEALRSATPDLPLALALRDLMHEADPDGACFDRACTLLVRAGGGAPSWPLLSGLRMLVQPQDDICIRPSVFFSMVKVVSPSRGRKVAPHGGHYRHLAAVARELRDRLSAAGEEPRDMLDVHDFIWETCRPSSASLLERVRVRAAEAEAQAQAKSGPAEDHAEDQAQDHAEANPAQTPENEAPKAEDPVEDHAEAA